MGKNKAEPPAGVPARADPIRPARRFPPRRETNPVAPPPHRPSRRDARHGAFVGLGRRAAGVPLGVPRAAGAADVARRSEERLPQRGPAGDGHLGVPVPHGRVLRGRHHHRRLQPGRQAVVHRALRLRVALCPARQPDAAHGALGTPRAAGRGPDQPARSPHCGAHDAVGAEADVQFLEEGGVQRRGGLPLDRDEEAPPQARLPPPQPDLHRHAAARPPPRHRPPRVRLPPRRLRGLDLPGPVRRRRLPGLPPRRDLGRRAAVGVPEQEVRGAQGGDQARGQRPRRGRHRPGVPDAGVVPLHPARQLLGRAVDLVGRVPLLGGRGEQGEDRMGQLVLRGGDRAHGAVPGFDVGHGVVLDPQVPRLRGLQAAREQVPAAAAGRDGAVEVGQEGVKGWPGDAETPAARVLDGRRWARGIPEVGTGAD